MEKIHILREEYYYRLMIIIKHIPRDLDLILGQEWLLQNDYVMTCSKAIPPLSGSLVQIPTGEKGIIFVDKQELLPGVYCGTSLSLCQERYFQCLVLNLTQSPITQIPLPKLEKPPTIKKASQNYKFNNLEHLAKLDEKLRLDHIMEGADAIRVICKEYVDIFKLPGDKLTVTNAAVHSIPTPSIPEGRAITLKIYRLAEAQKEEVNKQIKQMLEDELIIPSKSEWNFPLVVVPKKMDTSGKQKWRICIDFHKLNEASIGDSFLLPNIQDILDKVERARNFTALDCASSFHQIPIREEDRCKTVFSTPSGHFECHLG